MDAREKAAIERLENALEQVESTGGDRGNERLAIFMQACREAIETTRIIAQTEEDLATLTGDPKSRRFADWDVYELARAAQLVRQINEEFGIELIVKPEIAPWQAGRPSDAGYERAFARIYLTRECSPAEAFELYLSENQITPTDEDDRYQIWQRFDKAMKRRRKAAQ